MLNFTPFKRKNPTKSPFNLGPLITLLAFLLLLTECSKQIQTSFVDSSKLKPAILLILPQSFKVPIGFADNDDVAKLQQYVAIVNNVKDEKANQALRQQYKKLTLQVRDAKSPITGQLFFEHVFDYFAPEPKSQHLLIPLNLDQVSPSQEASPNGDGQQSGLLKRSQSLIISVRPYQLESGFGSDNIEIVSSAPVPVELVLSADGRRSFAVVQTDKPVYKPDEKVRIRALIINENLRPIVKDEPKLQIRNPQKIIVEEIRFSKSSNGTILTNQEPLYLDHILEFPPEPMLGTWTVHLLHNDPIANDTTSFEVKEYMLPPFDIRFESPRYILPSTQNITGSIVAKYHHGMPVHGEAHFKFGIKETHNSVARFIARSIIKKVDPITGRVDYKIGSERFKESGWFPQIAGSKFVVEAIVTEKATGHRETSQDYSCTFITLPYRVSFEDSIEDFKSGLTQQLTVQFIEMQTLLPAPAGLRAIAQYRDQNETLLGASGLFEDKPIDLRQSLDVETQTDNSGRATFNVGPLRDQVSSIFVTIKLLNMTVEADNTQNVPFMRQGQPGISLIAHELAVGHHTLVKHESINGWISLMNKTVTQLSIGDQFISDLFIRDAVVMPRRIYYLIISRGQIISMDTLSSEGLVSFKISESMMPSFRIVLFALTQDYVGLLSDSMRVNVDPDLSCGLSVQYNSNNSKGQTTSTGATNYRPNDKGRLAIQARQGDLVSIIGVDSAVYSMNNRPRLESSRIIQRIKRLDTGCGFGGGRNNLDVFYNAGLMLFKGVSDEPDRDAMSSHIGSSCLTVSSQLRQLEDIQLGYARPIYMNYAQQNRPRPMELAAAIRQKIAYSDSHQHRKKREVDVDSILKKYKNPIERSCCRLGTLEDSPQRRNCSVRARIVEKYMSQVEVKSCSSIYLECCRAVSGDNILTGSVLPAIVRGEAVIEPRVMSKVYGPQKNEFLLSSSVGQLDKIESETLIRKDFRETWLFDQVNVESFDGNATLDVQLPHSITTWSVTALALNKFQPMCIMPQPLLLTTFQEIFLQVSMPYKVIQGEQIDLLATIFNYSPQNQEVFVYMYGVDDVCSEAEPGERSERRRIRIEKHASQATLFPIIPVKIGSYNIKIIAATLYSNISDIVERKLNVVPRGKQVIDETTFSLDPMNHQRRSKRAIQTGNLVDEIDSSRGLQRSQIRLTPTRDAEYIVPETQECIVSAIGDKLGQTVQTTLIDVENLIRLPHGCGEQVMIYLGPTLYTAKYLSSVNKLTGDLRWRAIRYIQSGYRRILNFRSPSGAFRAFAGRDPSIWLTAFISKMLCQTERTPFIDDEVHIDRTVVNTALTWLIESQNNEKGTWDEMNPVYHREMLGGVLKENALTAFVALALNECAHHSTDLIDETGVKKVDDRTLSSDEQGTQRSRGLDKLKVSIYRAEQALLMDRHKAVRRKNPYVLALTAYALSFSRPKDAASILNDLMSLSERSQSRNQLYWRGDYQIETAAYALQALIELAPILESTGGPSWNDTEGSSNWAPGPDAIAIVNWLSSRRSYTGAFDSTQDTIVALEALSKYAQLQTSPSGSILVPTRPSSVPNLTCNVTVNNRVHSSLEFREANSQVLQTFKLDVEASTNMMLDILTSGNGLGTMSVRLKYNVFQEGDELCRFNIYWQIEEWRPKINDYGVITNEDESGKSEIIEDDFKKFNKSMLTDLNVIDANQQDQVEPKAPHMQHQRRQLNTRSNVSRRQVLRSRRHSPPTMDLSSASTSAPGNGSLPSRVFSSIWSKLTPWLAPKQIPAVATTITPATTTATTLPHPDVTTTNRHQDQVKKTNTSRRSTSASIPLVNRPPTIPPDVKVNNLSSTSEFDIADKNDANPHALRIVNGQSSRLILLLKVCVNNMSSRKDSEMAVIEVKILSGFKPNEADLKQIVQEPGTPAMKFELSADKSLVIIYLHYIPSSGQYCLQFRLMRDSLVYNLQSGYIRVYEYYSPKHSCSDYYTPSRIADLIETKCDSSGQVCQCATNSLCPATSKLMNLSDMHSVNATSARNKLIETVCSNRFDFISLVRLKAIRNVGAAKFFKLSVKVKSDLKGNLTKIIEAQRQQKSLMNSGIRKPPSLAHLSAEVSDHMASSEPGDEEDTSLDYLSLSIDSSCVKNDPLLSHLAHPSQWKQGGEMILFGRYSKIERRYFKAAPKSMGTTRSLSASDTAFPRPMPTSISALNKPEQAKAELELHKTQLAAAPFEDAQFLQYVTSMQLDRDSILHDITYQGKVGHREAINNLLLWLELHSRRDKWACPQAQAA